jgi:diguanylate cyclase (GGDEF)-like protein
MTLMTLRTSFRTKLLLLTLVPLGMAQFVTLFGVMHTVEKDVDSRARESLRIGAVVVDEFLAARGEQLRTSVDVLAADYGLKEAVATRDSITIHSVLENHGKRVDSDLAAILDLDGNVIASTVAAATGPIVDPRALNDSGGRYLRESTTMVDDTAFHVFVTPLRAPVTVAWVVVGFAIGDRLVDRLAGLTGLDVSVVSGVHGAAVTTTSRDHPPENIDVLRPVNTVYTIDEADEDHALTIQLPFVRGDGSVLVVLQRSIQQAMQPYAEARRALFVFGALLLALVALGSAWFTTTISRPLRSLSDAAQRMMSGDYATHVTVESHDEFGNLGNSFNAMQNAIAEREARISHSALHDTLTDLPNRAKVVKGLTSAIEAARRSDSPVAVLSLQLQRMSEISSTLGHNATDELIKIAARQLDASLDQDELLAHTGTTEFVIVLPGSDVANALSYVDRVQSILSSGVSLGRVNIILEARIGIAEFPRHGDSATDILRYAAIARAEAEERNERLHIYEPGREGDFVRRLKIVNDLPAALQRGEVQAWLQPKICLPEGRVCGAEALVRWHHPELGFLNPDDFVNAAEQSGTIVMLTRHVINEAVKHCKALQERGHLLQVSVNLSARDLLDEYLPYHLMQILNEHDLPGKRLTLEVTENSVMEDLRHAVSVLECIRDIGVRIAMDDFGTGHSSLAQLRNIPMNELKIDKSFVLNLTRDAHNESIVRTTVQLAHSMQLTVVAEGVEDEPTLHRLAALGCEQAQGYFIGKPMPANKMACWLDEFEPKSYADRRKLGRAFNNG